MGRTWEAVRAVLASRDLRRAQGGYAAFATAEQAVWIAMLVYAFSQGGAKEAGLVSVVQLLPAALAAPFLGTLADRAPPTRVQTAGFAAQGLAMAATAVVLLTDGPSFVAYAFAAVAATLVTLSRPTHAVLMPALSRTPRELTAAMVTTGAIDNASVLVAPAITGVILAFAGAGEVFAIAAALVGIGAILVAPLRATDPDPRRAASDDLAASGVGEITAGFRALREHRPARLIVGMLGLEHIAWGAVDVLAVVLALDLLDLGASGAGYLEAAFGAGGLVGVAVAMTLVSGRRLAPFVLGGALAWGVALAALGVTPSTAMAFVLFTVAGASRALLDVGARTLLLRVARPMVLARVFGIAEGLSMVGLATGALLVPALVAVGDPEIALAGVGALMVVLSAIAARSVLALDAAATVPVVELALLRSLPLFKPLPARELEGLAHALELRELPAASEVVRAGEEGHHYFAIADGEVEVLRDGTCVAVLGRGEGFGEIALLHGGSRTATVRARTDVVLYALDRESFMVALTGHEPTASVALAIVEERQAR